jgi:hypothetical protein
VEIKVWLDERAEVVVLYDRYVSMRRDAVETSDRRKMFVNRNRFLVPGEPYVTQCE